MPAVEVALFDGVAASRLKLLKVVEPRYCWICCSPVWKRVLRPASWPLVRWSLRHLGKLESVFTALYSEKSLIVLLHLAVAGGARRQRHIRGVDVIGGGSTAAVSAGLLVVGVFQGGLSLAVALLVCVAAAFCALAAIADGIVASWVW